MSLAPTLSLSFEEGTEYLWLRVALSRLEHSHEQSFADSVIIVPKPRGLRPMTVLGLQKVLQLPLDLRQDS